MKTTLEQDMMEQFFANSRVPVANEFEDTNAAFEALMETVEESQKARAGVIYMQLQNRLLEQLSVVATTLLSRETLDEYDTIESEVHLVKIDTMIMMALEKLNQDAE